MQKICVLHPHVNYLSRSYTHWSTHTHTIHTTHTTHTTHTLSLPPLPLPLALSFFLNPSLTLFPSHLHIRELQRSKQPSSYSFLFCWKSPIRNILSKKIKANWANAEERILLFFSWNLQNNKKCKNSKKGKQIYLSLLFCQWKI